MLLDDKNKMLEIAQNVEPKNNPQRNWKHWHNKK